MRRGVKVYGGLVVRPSVHPFVRLEATSSSSRAARRLKLSLGRRRPKIANPAARAKWKKSTDGIVSQ